MKKLYTVTAIAVSLALTSGADGKLQMPMRNMSGTANQ